MPLGFHPPQGTNPKGWKRLAGGRQAFEATSGQSFNPPLHLEKVPDLFVEYGESGTAFGVRGIARIVFAFCTGLGRLPSRLPDSAMEHIDREIKQDFKINWPVWYVLTGILVALMLFPAVMALVVHKTLYSFLFLGVAAGAVIATRQALRSALKDDADPQSSWRVTDAGLQRVYRHFKPEIIEWKQIQLLKWVPLSGLIILWSEARPDYRARSEWFRNEMSGSRHRELGRIRTVLPVQREEGEAVIAVAVSKTGLTADQLRKGPGILHSWPSQTNPASP